MKDDRNVGWMPILGLSCLLMLFVTPFISTALWYGYGSDVDSLLWFVLTLWAMGFFGMGFSVAIFSDESGGNGTGHGDDVPPPKPPPARFRDFSKN